MAHAHLAGPQPSFPSTSNSSAIPRWTPSAQDHADAFIAGAIQDGKVYGYPIWFYGFCNYLNTKQFKEVGLDPERDQAQTYAQLGEVAKRLTIKQGNKFVRQGFSSRCTRPSGR